MPGADPVPTSGVWTDSSSVLLGRIGARFLGQHRRIDFLLLLEGLPVHRGGDAVIGPQRQVGKRNGNDLLADTEETASALLRCVVRDPDPANVGRKFSSAAVELALSSYPGFHATSPPGDGQVYGVFRPAFVAAGDVPHVAVHADGTRVDIAPATQTLELTPVPPFALPEPLPFGETRRVPLGTIAGARSGDKGGSANVGVWVRTDPQWRWLVHALTVDKLRELLPETADLPVTRHVLPNLRAVNFVIEDVLGEGVAYQARFDPQAKALGEWLRSRHIEIPEELLD